MTSPTAKKPPVSKLEASKMIEQVTAALHYENQQLKRTLWLAAMQNSGKILVDEQKVDLLWHLSFTRTSEGLLQIEASKIPEAQETDVANMAHDLLGTNKKIGEYASEHERLKDYPLPYLDFALSKFIRFDGEKWKDSASFPPSPPS